jgi:hypothetical protein
MSEKQELIDLINAIKSVNRALLVCEGVSLLYYMNTNSKEHELLKKVLDEK